MMLSPMLKSAGVFVVLVASAVNAAQNSTSQTTANLFQEQSLIKQGHLDEAKALVLADIGTKPTVEAFNLLGIIDSEAQDYPGAVDAFSKALQLAPNSIQTHNNLGNVYLSNKKPDLAEKEFRTVLRVDPANQNATYNLGVLLMTKGAPAEAIRYFDRIHPRNMEASYGLIRAYIQTKRISDALRLATQISQEWKDDVNLHVSLGILLASENQFNAAQFEFERAEALQPNTFNILYNLGQASLRAGDNHNAELALSQALNLEPTSSETLYLLAEVYTNESRQLDALDLLVRANKLAPTNPDILYLMAKISVSQQYYEDATPLLEKALQIAPARPDLLALLGESYFKSNKMDKSIAVLTQLISIQPSVRAYAFLGLAHTLAGRLSDAKQDFHNGLELDPHSIFCLFQLGYIARMQGDSVEAEAIFLRILSTNPDYPRALLELADIRIDRKQYSQAAELLRRYVQASNDPATGYYKLAMVEKTLHQTTASEHDLAEFQNLSKNAIPTSHPYDNLFDYVDTRSSLAPRAKVQMDITNLNEQLKLHPGQSEVLYALAQAYLKLGEIADARATISQLDTDSPDDPRSLTNNGVLLARYRLYDDAIQHFQAALQVKPHSDDLSFDLADAYFRKGLYSDALDAAMQVTPEGRKDESYLNLLGDIYTHLGESARAETLYKSAILRNPDNDQDYLFLALLDFRKNDTVAAKQALLDGQARAPGSGKIAWGLGLASALEGDTPAATRQLERAVEILPEWPGAYSTLGVLYYQTGQIAKAKEVLDRFKNSNAQGGLDVNRIEDTLERAPSTDSTGNQPLSSTQRAQLIQFALFLADKTL